MAGFLYKGILLQQFKEPALSRDLREFLNADTMNLRMDRPPVENPDELTHSQIIEIARDAGIIDERDGTPLAEKLTRAREGEYHLLIGDAIDDEPYISSQLNPLLKHSQLAADGLSFCRRAVGCEDAYFAVYKDLTDLNIKIPKKIGDTPIVRLPGRYPAEYQASQTFSEEDGVLLLGLGALLHLARAIFFNKPQTTTFITVAGNCVGNPTNLEVSLGMTITQTLERCGLIDDPNRVVIGGSLTGISVIDTDNTLVTPTTRAILAFRQDVKNRDFSCIGCSRCVHVCPEGLNPYYLYRSVQLKRFDVFRSLDAHMCIGCGTCSYMCPAKLDLSKTVHNAAVAFRPMVSAIRSGTAAVSKYKETDYLNYLGDFKLGKAIRAHKRAGRMLRRNFVRRNRQALHDRNAEVQSAKHTLQEALHTFQNAERDAERTLREAQHEMQRLQKEADGSLRSVERERESEYRSADRALRDAEKAHEAAQRAADKLLSDLEHSQEVSEQSTIRDAQKELSALERGPEMPSNEELRKAQNRYNDICAAASKQRNAACEQAQISCKESKADAKSAFEHAVTFCERTKKEADKRLAAEQEACKKTKAETEAAYKRMEVLCQKTIDDAQEVYQQAQSAHETRLTEIEAAYEAAQENIALESYKEQALIDHTLREIRDATLLAAEEAAKAAASVTGRKAQISDLLLSENIFLCERELLIASNRLDPPEAAAKLPSKKDRNKAAEENVRAALRILTLPRLKPTHEEGPH